MPPHVKKMGVLTEVREHEDDFLPVEMSDTERKHHPVKMEIVWRNVILFAYLHMAALWGGYLMFTSAQIKTSLYYLLLSQLGIMGITGGAHRLWSHKSYKVKLPLKIFLALCQTLAFQNDIIEWARDHRMHHKYSETDADPYNAKRGYFFAHIGWLLVRKHPDVKKKGCNVDMSDLHADPVLYYQKKYFMVLMPLICFILPVIFPMYYFGETFSNAFFINLLRYTFTLHSVWLVNSVGHLHGERPYDRFINPAQNLMVTMFVLGEGWHNFHHTFPWDYQSSEMGRYDFNFTARFIELMAMIGQAYDLRTVSPEIIKSRVIRTGDGTHDLWGWANKDLTKQDRDVTLITHRKQL